MSEQSVGKPRAIQRIPFGASGRGSGSGIGSGSVISGSIVYPDTSSVVTGWSEGFAPSAEVVS